MTIQRGKIAFDGNPPGHPQWRFVGTYLNEPPGMALIEIFKDGTLVKTTQWPAYKIWNVPAHADDIITDIEDGLSQAGSLGPFGGNVYTEEDR